MEDTFGLLGPLEADVMRVLWAARTPGTAVVMAPVDFVPAPTTSLQPDVAVIEASETTRPKVTLAPRLVVEVLSPTNPFGIKAAGEGATTPAPAAVINAIVDALREFGVRDITMPATPQNIWRAIRGAQK